ncbi:sialate O-acetylesterase [Chryseobacterium sp.]|uniref:sialate O-acetylesterase n=1 Tax=Chryseobacterium sp. TaxID=1871047 RepID=UPI002897BC86|nr:sialate O-acetylesterase [Chryseobacterium sp.]
MKLITQQMALELGLSQAQMVALNNFLAFLKTKPISELEETLNPVGGFIPIDLGGGELFKISFNVFSQLIGHVAKPLAPTDPTPTSSGWYKPTVYSASPGTNYPNAGNLKAVESYDTLFYYSGTAWVDVKNKMPSNNAEQVFNPADNIKPASMKATYDASETLVNKGFEKSVIAVEKIGTDTQGVQNTNPSSNTNQIIANNLYCQYNGSVEKVTANFNSAGSVTLVVFQIESGKLAIKSQVVVNVVAGINEISVAFNLLVGQSIGFLFNIGNSIKFTDNVSGTYITNVNLPNSYKINPGYLAYTFESKRSVADNTYNVNSIISKLDEINVLKNIKNVQNTRILIEGQSNAYGVGLTSGLNSAPFNASSFDWTKEFSRVFIWNPKTNNYENLKIGVNNMASWDAFYKHPSGVATASSFGPEVGIALSWLQTHKYGNLYIDKNVGDGRPISYFQKGTQYYIDKLDRKNKADEWLISKGIDINISGFLWVQGESDRGLTDSQYLAALNSMMAYNYNEGFIQSNTIVVMAQVNPTNTGYGATVASAKVQYVNANKYGRVITYPNELNSDNVHLNTSGQIKLGMMAAKEIMVLDKMEFSNLDTKLYWTT